MVEFLFGRATVAEAARVVLWLTIVQPEGFSHFAPTYPHQAA